MHNELKVFFTLYVYMPNHGVDKQCLSNIVKQRYNDTTIQRYNDTTIQRYNDKPAVYTNCRIFPWLVHDFKISLGKIYLHQFSFLHTLCPFDYFFPLIFMSFWIEYCNRNSYIMEFLYYLCNVFYLITLHVCDDTCCFRLLGACVTT